VHTSFAAVYKMCFFPGIIVTHIVPTILYFIDVSSVTVIGGLYYYHILSRYLKSKNHFKLQNIFIEILYTTHYSIYDKYLYIALICIMYKYVPTQTSNVTFLSSYKYIVLFQFVIHIYLMLRHTVPHVTLIYIHIIYIFM